jgi:hypothetical protein
MTRSKATKNDSDIGMAVLRHLNANTASAGGPYFDIRAFLDANTAKHKLTKRAAKDVLWEMEKSGYVGARDKGIQWYDESYQASGLIDGSMELWYNLTWKGKAFILDHLKEGVLSRKERITVYIMLVLTIISTAAAIGQFMLTLCPC